MSLNHEEFNSSTSKASQIAKMASQLSLKHEWFEDIPEESNFLSGSPDKPANFISFLQTESGKKLLKGIKAKISEDLAIEEDLHFLDLEQQRQFLAFLSCYYRYKARMKISEHYKYTTEWNHNLKKEKELQEKAPDSSSAHGSLRAHYHEHQLYLQYLATSLKLLERDLQHSKKELSRLTRELTKIQKDYQCLEVDFDAAENFVLSASDEELEFKIQALKESFNLQLSQKVEKIEEEHLLASEPYSGDFTSAGYLLRFFELMQSSRRNEVVFYDESWNKTDSIDASVYHLKPDQRVVMEDGIGHLVSVHANFATLDLTAKKEAQKSFELSSKANLCPRRQAENDFCQKLNALQSQILAVSAKVDKQEVELKELKKNLHEQKELLSQLDKGLPNKQNTLVDKTLRPYPSLSLDKAKANSNLGQELALLRSIEEKEEAAAIFNPSPLQIRPFKI